MPVSGRPLKLVKLLINKNLYDRHVAAFGPQVSPGTHSPDDMSGKRTVGRSVIGGAGRRRGEALGALVAEEVVAREDRVDLQAVGAGVPLADVALEEPVVADDARPLAVRKEGLGRRAVAGLAVLSRETIITPRFGAEFRPEARRIIHWTA